MTTLVTIVGSIVAFLLAAGAFITCCFILGVWAESADEKRMARDVKETAAKLAALHNTDGG